MTYRRSPTYRKGDYAEASDPLAAAVMALGLLYETELPDEEAVEPTGFPPLSFDTPQAA